MNHIGTGSTEEASTGAAGIAGERVPLSFGQEQLWFLHQLAPGETTYNIALVWRLRGQLDLDVLRRSLTFVVGRHAALRVTMHAEDGEPYQVVSPPPTAVALPVVDHAGLTDPERERVIEAA